MNAQELESLRESNKIELNRLGCILVDKGQSPLMQLLAQVLGQFFLASFWTTWRLPGQKYVRIGYPAGYTEKRAIDDVLILRHELVHAAQFRPWWGPWWVILFSGLLPLPVYLSGRWFIERHAFLGDIKLGRITLDAAIETLVHKYGNPWPRGSMRRWFEARLK